MNSPKQKHAKSLGVCNTFVQAILTKKQLFLMFVAHGMDSCLFSMGFDMFFNPNPTSETWPKLGAFEEKKSFHSQMTSVFWGRI